MATAAAACLAVLAALLSVRPGGLVRLRAVVGLPQGETATRRARRIAVDLAGRVGFGPASRRRRAHARSLDIEALGALAAELLAGQPPRVALERAAGTPPAWPSALAAVRMDGDIATALRNDGRDRLALRQLAACWLVAAHTGSGLAASVERLAATARRGEQVRAELEGQLAAPRATARLLTGLPLVGVGFGVLLGADPVGWLLGASAGRMCLAAGLVLTACGTWWTGRIAARVERML